MKLFMNLRDSSICCVSIFLYSDRLAINVSMISDIESAKLWTSCIFQNLELKFIGKTGMYFPSRCRRVSPYEIYFNSNI